MILRLISVLTIVLFLFMSCLRAQRSSDEQGKDAIFESRVEHFYYGGYSDTVYALVYGEVYEMKKTTIGKDTLMPLSNVAIRVEKNDKSTVTNDQGQFELGLEKGLFSIVVSKQGYEPIQLTNYVSNPDQVSSTKIILVKGSEQRTFKIPKWTR